MKNLEKGTLRFVALSACIVGYLILLLGQQWDWCARGLVRQVSAAETQQ